LLKAFKQIIQFCLSYGSLRVTRTISYQNYKLLYSKLRPVNNGYNLIRIGPNGDGGYLIPDDLDGIDHVISGGSGNDWGFEKQLKAEINPSITILDTIDKKPADLDPDVDFIDAWLTEIGSKGRVSLEELLSPKKSTSIFLKIDIEGAEFEVLRSIPEHELAKIRILVVEFHGLERMLDRNFLKFVALPVLDKLFLKFDLVHAHGNNCCGVVKMRNLALPRVLEMTFHNKNRGLGNFGLGVIPHNLDKRIVEKRPELKW
jgi:hypothetical protein